MKKIIFNKIELIICLAVFSFLGIQNSSSQTFCTKSGSEQVTGEKDGFRYELWNQDSQGTACMTIGDGALFSGEWSGIQNYLARRGLGYDKTQEHQELGVFYTTYDCNYNPNSSSGNSYLSVYGWTVEPLVEYYIVEDWRNWIPSMDNNATLKGSFSVNGSIYDIYENTRVNKPSIVGTATFQQYFSIRRDERNSGTINISEHFEEWEALGMEMGKMFEVSYVIEGYQSSGSFDFTELDIFTSDSPIVGTHEANTSANLNVYPNPTSGNVFIELDESISTADVAIYNALGKSVFSQKNINGKRIEVSNLNRGIYFVNVNSNKLNYINKLLVL